jgi:hypothetical protein
LLLKKHAIIFNKEIVVQPCSAEEPRVPCVRDFETCAKCHFEGGAIARSALEIHSQVQVKSSDPSQRSRSQERTYLIDIWAALPPATNVDLTLSLALQV